MSELNLFSVIPQAEALASNQQHHRGMNVLLPNLRPSIQRPFTRTSAFPWVHPEHVAWGSPLGVSLPGLESQLCHMSRVPCGQIIQPVPAAFLLL